MAHQRSGRKLQTVQRGFDIISAVEDLDGATITEVANHLGISPSTAHGYMVTLEDRRYLVRDRNEYNIGLKFLSLGGYASVRIEGYRFIKQKVQELAEETEERTQFIVEEHGIGVYVYTVTADSAVEIDARVGKERHLHASAAGKSILAHMPEQRVENIIGRWGLPEVTKNTITDRDKLMEELARVRENGYSTNKEESVPGLRAVGAPIKNSEGQVLGALSISGPSKRMQGDGFESGAPMGLLGTTNEIELKIAHDQS